MTRPVTDGRQRWAPWWAIACTLVSMVLPALVLAQGIDLVLHGMSGAYMSELSAAIGPLVVGLGVFLLLPGVAYLSVRAKWLFWVAIAVGGVVLLIAGGILAGLI